MRMRSKVNRGRDKRIFARTAVKTNVKNIPGKIISRGGIRL